MESETWFVALAIRDIQTNQVYIGISGPFNNEGEIERWLKDLNEQVLAQGLELDVQSCSTCGFGPSRRSATAPEFLDILRKVM